MHQELNPQGSELEELQPSSRSSWTDNNPSSPLFQNYIHFQTLVHQHQLPSHQQLTNHQLHQLIYNKDKVYDPSSKSYIDKFVATIMDYNNLAYTKILQFQKKQEKHQKKKKRKKKDKKESSSPSESSIKSDVSSSSKLQHTISTFLNQAERILQYAASCGRLINRKLIIILLINQASYYQKLWELQKSCSYIEATILNMEQWGQQSQWSEISTSQIQFEEDNILSKPNYKKQPRPSADFSTKAQMKHEQTLSQKFAQHHEYESNKLALNCYWKEMRFNQQKDIANHIAKMCQLTIYYLQYCSLCGQLSHHEKAIEAAKKVINKMKKVININKYYYIHANEYKNEIKSSIRSDKAIDINRTKFIIGLSEVDEGIQIEYAEEEVERYRETARFYLKERDLFLNQNKKSIIHNFQKINRTQSLRHNQQFQREEDDASLKQIQKIREEIKVFTIGNILQIKPRIYNHNNLYDCNYSEHSIDDRSKNQLIGCQIGSPFSFQFIFTNALLLSTGYFTLATELRLQAAKQELVEGERFHSKMYKESQIYHLIAIIIISIYVPIQILYLKQLVTSYENYYVRQINPLDETNQYGSGSNNNEAKELSILNDKFDKLRIFKYKEKQSLKDEEKKIQEIEEKKEKKKKSKNKSQSSKSKSLKNRMKDQEEYKGFAQKNKSLKTSYKPRKSYKNSIEGIYQIPYISNGKPRQSHHLFFKTKNLKNKKKCMSHSIIVKVDKSASNTQSKYNMLLNNISRSANMLNDKTKLNNQLKYQKNVSMNSNFQKPTEFPKIVDKQFNQKDQKGKRKRKGRQSSKELKFLNKKRNQYKLTRKSPKKEGSVSKLWSKSKSKEKSKPKDSSIPNCRISETKKIIISKNPVFEQGLMKQKNQLIDQLSRKIESTRKRQDNLESYYDEKDTKKQLKLNKKGNKKNKQNALSNSVSKKMAVYKPGKLLKQSSKTRMKKAIPT